MGRDLENPAGIIVNSFPIVSFIVCTVNRVEPLCRLLTSLYGQLDDQSEIILVDQNMDGKLTAILEKFPRIHHIKMTEQGLSRARNCGLKKARGEIMAFLDDDAVCTPHFLENIREIFRKQPNLSLAAGRILVLGTEKPFRIFHKRKIPVRLGWLSYRRLFSGCFAIRRSAWEKVGDFDCSFGIGGTYGACEESDWLFRLLKVGLAAEYHPNICIYHEKPKVINKEVIFKIDTYSIGFGALFAKHLTGTGAFFRLILFCGIIVSHLGLAAIEIFTGNRHHTRVFICACRGFWNYHDTESVLSQR